MDPPGKPKQCSQSPEANISYELPQANELPNGACWCAPIAQLSLCSFQWSHFWCLAPTPLNENFCCCCLQCSWKLSAAKILLSEWYALILNPSSRAIDSRHWARCIVLLALFEYCGKLNILTLAWSTNKLPHVYPTRSLPNVCRRQLELGEKSGQRKHNHQRKMIRFERVRFWQRTRCHIWWRLCGSLSKEARRTFHIRNIAGRSTTLCDSKGFQVKCGVGITSVGKPFPILHQCLDPICRGMQQSLVPH